MYMKIIQGQNTQILIRHLHLSENMEGRGGGILWVYPVRICGMIRSYAKLEFRHPTLHDNEIKVNGLKQFIPL